MFAIRVLAPPDFGPFITSNAPKGVFLSVSFELTNLQSRTDYLSLWDDELLLAGQLDGRRLIFEPTDYGVSRNDQQQGFSTWTTDLPPGVPVKVKAMFDVNPYATDWTLILEPEEGFEKICHVEVAVRYSANPDAAPVAIIGNNTINIRQGPGTNYPVVGQSGPGEMFEIVGRNESGDWWQICCIRHDKAWIAGWVVSTRGDTSSVPVVGDIPAPPATPTPFPRIVPMGQEITVGNWGLRLYAVKKAKTVYFFGDPQTAQGHYLLVFIEFRNSAGGTREPSRDFNFYLVDDKGRQWQFDVFGDAVLPASWQFIAGHLYDDIQPGATLGIVLPFDVPDDTNHVFLRVQQDRKFVMYLGDVSSLPISEK